MFNTYFREGNKFLREQELKQAINSYQSAIEQNPNFYLYYQNLGEALEQSGRFEESVANYQEAINLRSDLALPYYNLGRVLYKLGRIKASENSIKKAIKIEPKLADFPIASKEESNHNSKLISKYDTYQKEKKIDDALFELFIDRFNTSTNQSSKSIIDDYIYSIVDKVANSIDQEIFEATPIYEHSNNPKNYEFPVSKENDNLSPLVSLTTISSRISRIKQTIQSIINQTLKPHSINLYISEEPYMIDQGISAKNDYLKEIADLGVNVYQVKNTGPYRKQYPLISQLRQASAHPKTPMVTLDDDVVYPSNLLELLMNKLEQEDVIVAHRGREITFDESWIANYQKFQIPGSESSYLNIGTGKNGIAYRLGYFPTNVEDFIGPILAPTADDIWCKWVTSLYCIPTTILEPKAAYDPSLDFAETDSSDKNGLFHKYNTKGSNDKAITNLELYFSIRRGENIFSLFGKGGN